MTKRLSALLCLLIACLVYSAPARALCVAGICSCSVATTNVAFGSYNPFAFGNTDTTGSVKVTCAGVAGLLIPFNIAISAGSGGSYTNRRMKSGANWLTYNLYTDASYTTIWGDGSNATQILNAGLLLDLLGLSSPQSYYVYGRIPGRQLTAVPGSYADTISVTLTYY